MSIHNSRSQTVALGLDLAWSVRNRSGGAVIVDGVLAEARGDLAGDAEIVAWVGAWVDRGDAVILAVDAPLCVPNATGRRACETQLGHDWRHAHAGPYPSNRNRFAAIGIRGERLVARLNQAYGFVETTELDANAPGCYVCEVFPHPAHVSLFARKSILKYKKKGKRSYAECWAGLDEYAALLKTLAAREPPMHDPLGLLPSDFDDIRGKRLKELEDILDAVTCAYIGAYCAHFAHAGTLVYGTVADGHILVPRYPPIVNNPASMD